MQKNWQVQQSHDRLIILFFTTQRFGTLLYRIVVICDIMNYQDKCTAELIKKYSSGGCEST